MDLFFLNKTQLISHALMSIHLLGLTVISKKFFLIVQQSIMIVDFAFQAKINT